MGLVSPAPASPGHKTRWQVLSRASLQHSCVWHCQKSKQTQAGWHFPGNGPGPGSHTAARKAPDTCSEGHQVPGNVALRRASVLRPRLENFPQELRRPSVTAPVSRAALGLASGLAVQVCPLLFLPGSIQGEPAIPRKPGPLGAWPGEGQSEVGLVPPLGHPAPAFPLILRNVGPCLLQAQPASREKRLSVWQKEPVVLEVLGHPFLQPWRNLDLEQRWKQW